MRYLLQIRSASCAWVVTSLIVHVASASDELSSDDPRGKRMVLAHFWSGGWMAGAVWQGGRS